MEKKYVITAEITLTEGQLDFAANWYGYAPDRHGDDKFAFVQSKGREGIANFVVNPINLAYARAQSNIEEQAKQASLQMVNVTGSEQ